MKPLNPISIMFGLFFLLPAVALPQCNDEEGTADSLYTKCYKPRLDESNENLKREVAAFSKLLKEHYRTKGTIAADWFSESQTAWERYRYLFCEVHSIARVGPQSSRALEGVECKIALNEKRLSELTELKKVLLP